MIGKVDAVSGVSKPAILAGGAADLVVPTNNNIRITKCADVELYAGGFVARALTNIMSGIPSGVVRRGGGIVCAAGGISGGCAADERGGAESNRWPIGSGARASVGWHAIEIPLRNNIGRG